MGTPSLFGSTVSGHTRRRAGPACWVAGVQAAGRSALIECGRPPTEFMNTADRQLTTVHSGIDELDDLLNGGYVTGRTYLIQGGSGTGKSMLGQTFLEAGLENDETVVYIHGEESRSDITTNALQVGIDIADAEFLDIGPGTDFFTEDIAYELVAPTEVESERFTKEIKDVIEDVDPQRLLIDPITQLQYVERDAYQYRKRLQSLIRFLRAREVTAVATRTITRSVADSAADNEIESLSDGIVNISLDESERRIEVPKHRGLGQQNGTHGLEIRNDGVEIFPQIVPKHHDRVFDPERIGTGDSALDDILGGGIERGSVTFISGPTGIGKSTTGAQLLTAVGEADKTALGYLFEESIEQFTYRCDNLGIPVGDLLDDGALQLTEVEPLVQSAEEFGRHVLREIEAYDADTVLIDGLSGYKLSLQGESTRVVRRLHALTRVLKNRGIAVVITDESSTITGIPRATSTNTSYLADNIIYLTYVEVDGGLERAFGVLKKRLGDFDSRFHRFHIETGEGFRFDGPFDGLTSIIQGTAADHDSRG